MPENEVKLLLVLVVLLILMPFPAEADFAQVTVGNDISGKVARSKRKTSWSSKKRSKCNTHRLL
ncbi:MAG: hypothetical protein AB9861_05885 [Methanosarcina sp.]